jgi:hypothetical protein
VNCQGSESHRTEYRPVARRRLKFGGDDSKGLAAGSGRVTRNAISTTTARAAGTIHFHGGLDFPGSPAAMPSADSESPIIVSLTPVKSVSGEAEPDESVLAFSSVLIADS